MFLKKHTQPGDQAEKIILISIIFFLTFTNSLIAVISSFSKGITDLLIVEMIIAVTSMGLFLRSLKKFDLFSKYTAIIMLGVVYLFLIATGGTFQNGYLWTFSFPIGAFFILGLRGGSISTLLFILFLLVVFALSGTIAGLEQRSLVFKVWFLGSYMVIYLTSYLYEKARCESQKRLSDKNSSLERALENLEANERIIQISLYQCSVANVKGKRKRYIRVCQDIF
jgi:hypothetical protein